jgi:hypothetical protein
MRLLLTLFVCLTSAVCAETLPQIEGENLMGRKIVLPEAAAGRRAILVIGFSHASQGQTKAWADRLDREFPNPAMVTMYPVAVLEAVPRLVRGMASQAARGAVAQYDAGTEAAMVAERPKGDTLTGLLQRAFGFSSFRANQEAVCEAVVTGRDVLLVDADRVWQVSATGCRISFCRAGLR